MGRARIELQLPRFLGDVGSIVREKRLRRFEVLTSAQVEDVHKATLDVLASVFAYLRNLARETTAMRNLKLVSAEGPREEAYNLFSGMWLHPWDVLNEGVDNVLENIRNAGINTVNLAASYHTGMYLLEHNSHNRLVFAEEGVVYFKPELSMYGSLKPAQSKRSSLILLDEVTDRAENCDMDVVAWTVLLHNTRLATEYPDAATKTVDGDTNINSLCPNNPDVRGYLLNLVDDIASNHHVTGIQLESPSYPEGITHGYHHELHSKPLTPTASLILSSCFCEHCVKKAKQLGLNLEETRKGVTRVLGNWASTSSRTLSEIPPEDQCAAFAVALSTEPSLKELVRFRALVMEEVLSEIRQRVGDKTHLYYLTPPPSTPFQENFDYGVFKSHVDAVQVLSYSSNPARVYQDVAWSRLLIPRDCELHVGLKTSHPEADTDELIMAEIESAHAAGSDGFCFYSYGLTALTLFPAIRQALSKV